MSRTTLLILLVLGLIWWAWPDRPDPYYSERLATVVEPSETLNGLFPDLVPRQQMLSSERVIRVDDLEIRPRATFALAARVLGKLDYRNDRWSRLSPVDLALGWGPMSDPVVLSEIKIRQRRRFYFWRVDSFPIPREQIESSSANMHIVPGNLDVLEQLAGIESGDEIRLQGYLVDIDRDDGAYWRTSLRRDDTGDGACELFLVTALMRL